MRAEALSRKPGHIGAVAFRLPALLRNNRRGLPYLLLALDRTDPLELMVLVRLRLSAQNGGLEFKKIQSR
jgi:hypothetical protein